MKDFAKDVIDRFTNLCEIFGDSNFREEIEIKRVIDEEIGLKTSPPLILKKIQAYEGDEDYRMLLAFFISVMLPILVYLLVLEPSRALNYLFQNFMRKKTNVDEVIKRFLHKDFKAREPKVFFQVQKCHVILFILLILMVTWTYNMHKPSEALQNCFEDYIDFTYYEERIKSLAMREFHLKLEKKNIWDLAILKLTETERKELSSDIENMLQKYDNALNSIRTVLAYNTSMLEKNRVRIYSIVYFLTAIVCFFKIECRTCKLGYSTFFKIVILSVFCHQIILFYTTFYVQSMRILLHKESDFLEKNLFQNMPEVMTYLWG